MPVRRGRARRCSALARRRPGAHRWYSPCTASRPTRLSWAPVSRTTWPAASPWSAPDLRGRGRQRRRCPARTGSPRTPTTWPPWPTRWARGRVVLAGPLDGRVRGRPDRGAPPGAARPRCCWWTAASAFPLPADLAPDELITAVIGPAMRRLSMTFPDRAAYRVVLAAAPGLRRLPGRRGWTTYIQRDLVGEEPALRSSCALEAVRTDGVDQLRDEVAGAVHRLPVSGRAAVGASGG